MNRLQEAIKGDTVWYSKEMEDGRAWLEFLNEQDREEILNALDFARKRGCTADSVLANDFPLPGLAGKLKTVGRGLDASRGFRVLRGVPLDSLPLKDIELLYAGLSAHLGKLVNQDTDGTLIDYVCDRGNSYDHIAVRGYTTNAQLTPHCDTGDLLALLCVRPAKSGGTNNISCSMAIYNEMLAHFPDLLEPLYRGYFYNIRGNGPHGPHLNVTAHRVPVFSYYQGRLSCRFNQKAILTAPELPGVPPLSDRDIRAIDTVAELAMSDDIRLDVDLLAGDLAFFNNHTVLHNRDPFTDFDEPDRMRLLLRQWINLEEARPLHPDFADHYNTGPRMGPAIHLQDMQAGKGVSQYASQN